MQLIDQHTKQIMEECKLRARDAGLRFDNDSLEYIVTNRDLLELSPKVMIPTLYDYWVNDVEILKGKGIYKLYPNNPYETVINSRPAISFYNDNNPDWMNIMIFYHVLGHIDFFQNNLLFKNTWNDDFVGQALADKRLIDNLRSEYGRWVDYLIEFSRSLDNLVGFFENLASSEYPQSLDPEIKTRFYFDFFLQEIVKSPQHEIFREVEKYNNYLSEKGEVGIDLFFSEVVQKHPEFQAKFEKFGGYQYKPNSDVIEFIRDNSRLLKEEGFGWMKSIMTIIRNTSLYFAPQIRTKIINEGWASYWHDTLFRADNRIKGHEVAYSVLNAGVTSISRVGLNPYAIGLRLIQYVEELADKGKLNYKFQLESDSQKRENFDLKTTKGREAIFNLRANFSDFMLINTFVEQEFTDKHNLFVVGQLMDQERGVVQYYVKSRKAEDYKQMLIESLYHPPKIHVDYNKTDEKTLYLVHNYEGKPLYKEYIPDVLIGAEFLWGGTVKLETTDAVYKKSANNPNEVYIETKRVVYTVNQRKVGKEIIS